MNLTAPAHFTDFSRQIMSGLCPLAPTLRPSRALWPIITSYSFDLFISLSLSWVAANGTLLLVVHDSILSMVSSGAMENSSGEQEKGKRVEEPKEHFLF